MPELPEVSRRSRSQAEEAASGIRRLRSSSLKGRAPERAPSADGAESDGTGQGSFASVAARVATVRDALRDRARRGGRRLRRDILNDQFAAVQVVMFLITAAIFLPAITFLVIYLDDAGSNQAATTGGLHNLAASTLHQLTSSEGYLPDGSTNWDEHPNPHTMTEAGLLAPNGYALEAGKIKNLQNGGYLRDASNGVIDYLELKDALGVGDRFDFHIRAHPIITNTLADPYAVEPVQGFHVAYVANLSSGQAYDGNDPTTWDHEVDQVTAAFDNPTPQALRELEALVSLKLTTDSNNETNGFDNTWYMPHVAAPSNLPELYTNAAPVTGDIIADTDRVEINGTLVTKEYDEWFWDTYFDMGNEDWRFDAIVFGSDVNHARWNTAQSRAILENFTNDGGVVVFLGTTSPSAGLFADCAASSSCLLRNATSQSPYTIPDASNPLIAVPNQLDHLNYKTIGTPHKFWSICDSEREGFLPIVMDRDWADTSLPTHDCPTTFVHKTVLGASASDKFTENGIVIVSAWDVSEGNTGRVGETARFLSNVLNYGLLRSAYLDVGPTIPDGAPVETAQRTLLLTTDRATTVDVRISMHMWRM